MIKIKFIEKKLKGDSKKKVGGDDDDKAKDEK